MEKLVTEGAASWVLVPGPAGVIDSLHCAPLQCKQTPPHHGCCSNSLLTGYGQGLNPGPLPSQRRGVIL